jgi:cell division protein FtsQ
MKKFWNIFKKVLIIQAVMTVVMLFVVTLMSAVREQKHLVCSSIHVDIDYNSGLSFLTTDEVSSKINELADGDAVGKALPALDLRGIEKGLLQDPFIAKAKIYIDHSRVLHAEITQKRPIMRVMNNDGVGYYLSDKNEKIPLCSTFTAHVPLAIGAVDVHENSSRDSVVLSQLFLLAKYLETDTLIGALIDHTYVLPDGQFEMYPKFGYHTIEFGKADEMKEKFEKLKIFYTQGLAKVGWNKYKVINLKYQGQVVCEKTGKEEEEKKVKKEDKQDEAATQPKEKAKEGEEPKKPKDKDKKNEEPKKPKEKDKHEKTTNPKGEKKQKI